MKRTAFLCFVLLLFIVPTVADSLLNSSEIIERTETTTLYRETSSSELFDLLAYVLIFFPIALIAIILIGEINVI